MDTNNFTRFHFIAGLPRSGSTLLSAILRQNPRFHAAMSTPVGGLCNLLLNQMGGNQEFAVFLNEEKKKDILHSIFESYYKDQSEKEVIFDTNRIWTSKLAPLKQLYPDAKVLCCVRNVAWVMDSFERLYRRNAFDYSRIYGPEERGTVYTRCESLAKLDRVVGFAWAGLKEAYYGEYSSSLLVIDYKLLTRFPAKTMEMIYQFIGEAPFEHDFNDVEYDEPEFDSMMGAKGLHRVKGKVEFKPRRTVLPPDLFDKYDKLAFWKDQRGSAANVITAKPVKSESDDEEGGLNEALA